MDGAGSDLDFSHRRVIAGIVVQSLALLADAAHLFTDAAALAIAVAAVRIARRPADAKCTYGYHRFEILAAAFNAALLFGVALYILCEAYRRFNAPAEGQPLGMLIVATLVLAVDLLNTRFLQAGKDTSRNVKGAYLEVWADMLGSFGVIVAALVIRFTGPAWVDTLAAVGMGLWVLPRTWVLLKESLTILLEGAPEGVDVDEVGRTMLAVPGRHWWPRPACLDAHQQQECAHRPRHSRSRYRRRFPDRTAQGNAGRSLQVFHTTLQIEPTACRHSEDGCNFVGQRLSAKPPESNAGHVH